MYALAVYQLGQEVALAMRSVADESWSASSRCVAGVARCTPAEARGA